MIRKEESIFQKIKFFLKKIFKKDCIKNNNTIVKNEISVNTIDNHSKKDFITELQKDIKSLENRKKIISYIENNENCIYNLTNEKLEKLIELYDKSIADIDIQINQLKHS